MKKFALSVVAFLATMSQAFAAIAPPTNQVPEPETLALIGIAGAALAAARYFRK